MRIMEITRTRLFLSFLANLLFAGFVCVALSHGVYAVVLVEDTFDYPVGDINGNSGGIGWGGNWAGFFNSHVSGFNDVMEGSLPFSNFPTQGNRVRMANLDSGNTGSVDRQYSRTSRTVDVTKDSGTLWVAFLYRRIDTNEGADSWAELRDNAGYFFGMTAKTSQSSDTGSGSANGISVRYDNERDSVDESVSVQDGEVYLMVSRFTEVGVFSGNGTGTMWAISEANYGAIVADGSITEAELDANYTLKDVDDDPGALPKTILPGHEMRWVNGVMFDNIAADFEPDGDSDGADFLTWQRGFGINSGAVLGDGDADASGSVDATDLGIWEDDFGKSGGGYAESIYDYDELRYGDELGDVVLLPLPSSATSVPEPSSLILASLAFIFCARGYRTQRYAS